MLLLTAINDLLLFLGDLLIRKPFASRIKVLLTIEFKFSVEI